MHLTLKRLEDPGSGKVGWGCRFGDILLETEEEVWDGEQLGGGLDRDED
jgi:hypothetical protein